VWVYPFDEYHHMTFARPTRLEPVFFGDWFMRGAVNNGLPLNTVVSTTNFATALQHRPEAFAESILVSPMPDQGTAWAEAILHHVRHGGGALLYGPVGCADDGVLEALNLAQDDGLHGEFELTLDTPCDRIESLPHSMYLQHFPLFCAGAMCGVTDAPRDPATRILAAAEQRGKTRITALTRACSDWGGGRIAWVRGTVSCDPEKTGGHLLVPLDPARAFPAEILMRYALASFGYEILNERVSASIPAPMLCISRHRNAFIFSGYSANSTAALLLRTPHGIPLLSGLQARIVSGRARYIMPTAWQRECRVFIEQERDALVECRIRRSGFPGISQRLELTGLQDATVRFFYEPGTSQRVEMRLNSPIPCLVGESPDCTDRHDAPGHYLEAADVSGQMMISW